MNSKKSSYNPIGLYDISKDDSEILFSFNDKGNSSIYCININTGDLKLLVHSSKDSVYSAPKYNKDGEKILFIGSAKNNLRRSDIYLSKSDGTGIQKITDGEEMISEAIFSKCENKIYYIKSTQYGNNSPLATKQYHGTDIYEVDLTTKMINRLTSLNAYAIFRISEFNCNKLLLYMPIPEQGGMIILNKIYTDSLVRINPVNNPRNDFSLYSSLIFSEKYKMFAFIAPYELYIMNDHDRIANPIISNLGESFSMIEEITFFNNSKKIIYTNNVDTAFFVIDYKGKNLRTLPIKFVKSYP